MYSIRVMCVWEQTSCSSSLTWTNPAMSPTKSCASGSASWGVFVFVNVNSWTWLYICTAYGYVLVCVRVCPCLRVCARSSA